MEAVKFKGKIWKTGTSYVITIPKDFVKNGLIKPELEYLVEIGDYFQEEKV